MPIFANERFSGENHVSAANRAQTNNGIIGGNFVFTNGKQLALTVSPVTGEVSVADGAFAFDGRLGGVVLSESASYTPPPSDTAYIKNIVVIRYKRNAATNVETYSLAVVSSEIQASESAAQALSLSLASDVITDSTTVAEFPLWEFIATASSNTVPEQRFVLIPSMIELKKEISDNADNLQKEIAQRKTETEMLDNAVKNIKKGLETIAKGLTGKDYDNSKIQRADFIAFVMKFSNNETMTIPSIPGNYRKYFYKVEELSLNAATKVTEMYRGVQLASGTELDINFFGTSSNDCPYVTEIYGIR